MNAENLAQKLFFANFTDEILDDGNWSWYGGQEGALG